MKYAAIDIGSNAMRLLIAEVVRLNSHNHIKKLQLIRVPIRLGENVFTSGVISEQKIDKLITSIKAFKLLMEVYGVQDYMACATSAMRESINGNFVVSEVKAATGVDIEIIDGKKEANYIHSTFETIALDLNKKYLYIDVGGGSTELSLIENGKPVRSQSFKVGTVRMLQGKVLQADIDDMINFAEQLGQQDVEIEAIGSGGNINKLIKLGPIANATEMTYNELDKLISDLSELSLEERISTFDLKEDRADVIVPAGKIYTRVMKAAKSERIFIPKMGLSDGMVYALFLKAQEQNLALQF